MPKDNLQGILDLEQRIFGRPSLEKLEILGNDWPMIHHHY